MPKLAWHKPGSRTYQNGIDRGVLYLPDGTAVPWNGLTSVKEGTEVDTDPVYFDGRKINDGISVGDFTASLSAVTYPEEFEALEGSKVIRNGMIAKNQPPTPFALCYRTLIGNDLGGDVVGYKINVIWNVTAIPSDKEFASISDSQELVEFEWDLVAVPQELPGVRPTAHLVIDTRYLDPWLLEDLEEVLYGGTLAEASLMPMPEFFEFLSEWYRVKIIDNGDGTWTAEEQRPGFINFMDDAGMFQIVKVNASYLDEDTYMISDTVDVKDTPRVEIYDNGNGTWTASTEDDNVIVVDEEEGTFEIRAVEVAFAGPDMYRISNQESTN